ncbi:RHS repeat domain-containing protein [Flavobacterium chungangensis]|uniref:RHS repeat-associated core domain-containing protein n=1 Tax=Flavobacterium chungangensis TaxID=2708132 RepID=A0ABV8ZA29_9FLAO
MADRRTQVIQPDAGKSTFKFDALNNLLERQTANLEAKSKKITYEYEFNRLTNIHYPENPQNDVRYVFGSKNESQNRKGRLILLEDATGAQEFSYGVLGEIESIRRTVIVPNSAIATYVTSWKYDSWNRLQEMIYPDQEKVNYTYNSGGLLQAVAGKKAYSYNYVNKIGYDKFEQRSYLKYCNGTETKYNYEPLRRRLDNMTVASGTGYQGNNTPRMFMNNKYQYDKVSNVLNVTNSAAGVANKMGGIMSHNYAYDNLYQLTSASGIYTGADQKTANYSLEMKYDDLHNIVSKTQNVMQNKVTETGILKAGYTMNYNYNSTNKHQLDNVTETEYRTKNTDPKVDKNKNNKYVYDKNGNMIYVNTDEVKTDGKVNEKAQEKKFLWDEENRLGAVDINGYVSNYTYDAGGERVTKLSGGGQGIFVNSVFSGGKTSTSDFTLYVNPYLVAQSGGRYTKHIYIGSQRIVSKLGDFDSYGADPRRVEKAGESFSGVKVNYDAKYKKSLDVVKANYASFEVPYYGLDNNDYVNGLGFCCNPSGETNSSSTTGKMTAKNDNAELQQFYYHPDHLGSSSYISNLDGEVVQHIEYVPFGEVFLEEKNAKWNTPYLFTSKELDRETGLYYFGARYQDPKLGIFISVDLLTEKHPNYSSYNYVANNPIKLIDPDGKDWVKNKASGKYEWKKEVTSLDNTPKEYVYIGREDSSIVYDLFGQSSFKTSDWDMGSISGDTFDNAYSAKGAAVYNMTAESTLNVAFSADVKTKYDSSGEIKTKEFLGINIFATVSGETNAPYPNIGALSLRGDKMSLQGKQMGVFKPGPYGGISQGGDVPSLNYQSYWSAGSIQSSYGKSSNLNFSFKGVYFDTDSLKSLTAPGFGGLIPFENTTNLNLSIPFNNASSGNYINTNKL